MNAKKYAALFVAVMSIFLMINMILWHGTVKAMFNQRDLNRLGFFSTSEPEITDAVYTKHHVELRDYLIDGTRESFDIVTFGDSFSFGQYQDYLAEKYGIKSLNFRVKFNCLIDFYICLSSGLLDELNPRVVILESVEREVQNRLGQEKIAYTLTTRQELEQEVLMKKVIAGDISSGILPPVMTQANVNFLSTLIFRRSNPEYLSSSVHMTKLSRDLFTNPDHENTLLFHDNDLFYLTKPVNADMINDNLNSAVEILRAKGIRLIFMPCVDKYDLYYPYIIDKNGRPENPLFTKLREISRKSYTFIDTKAILQEAIELGEKDLYWCGDTHWSFKGYQLICDELVKYLQP